MFDLTLAHYHTAERERDLSADLRDRRILKSASQTSPAASATRRPSATPRAATRARAYGR
ncbi:MAG: hypothetical protein ACJ771_00275 [Chloroflexota bacterium]